MSDSRANTGELDIPDLIDDFRELAEINHYMQTHPYETEARFRRDDIADGIGEKLEGRWIRAVELPIARELGERAIKYLHSTTDEQLKSMARVSGRYEDDRRTHPATGDVYVHHALFQNRRRSRGKVQGIDRDRSSIVARPRLTLLDRAWIKVADAEGEQLVDLSVQ